jgi:type II secretion system protein H
MPAAENIEVREESARQSKARAAGFTLVEVLLVMAILTIAVALIVPAVARFFDGRSLDSEVQRFLSLTRYGQSRAVSEGIPMMLWIDPNARTYGLEQQAGYTDKDAKAEDFSVAKDISINVPGGSHPSSPGSKQFAIFFSPDGTPVTATSVSRVGITLGSEPPVWIALSGNGITYEAQHQ